MVARHIEVVQRIVEDSHQLVAYHIVVLLRDHEDGERLQGGKQKKKEQAAIRTFTKALRGDGQVNCTSLRRVELIPIIFGNICA